MFTVLLSFAGAVLANMGTIQAKFNNLTFEERTELAFVDNAHLPKHYTPDANQNFDFYFINYENQEVNYSFDITAKAPGGEAIEIGSGSGSSGHNLKGVVSPEFTLQDMGPRVKITVELNYETDEGKQSKAISFWVERQSVPSSRLG